jgi:hypothetical protein
MIDTLGKSTDIWFGQPANIMGGAHIAFLKAVVSTQFVGAGATLGVDLDEAPDGATWAHTVLGNYPPGIPVQYLTPGAVLLWAALPLYGGSILPIQPLLRWLSVYYTVVGGPFTAGAVNAWLDVV